jgi:hypothetical protein
MLSATLSLALLGLAAGGPGDAVKVLIQSDGVSLTVTVVAPTGQRDVLSALCDRLDADCDLAGVPEKATVGPSVFAGAWDEVVAQVFEGSSTGYAAVPPGPGRKARLVVTRTSPQSPTSAVSSDGPEKDAQAELPSTMDQGDVEAEAPSADPAGTEADRNEETGASDGTSARGGSSDSLAAAPAPVAPVTAAPAGFAMTPFADGGGKPLLVPAGVPAEPGVVVTPFSTETGEPLVVPQTGEAPTVAPFSGPDGEPIPVMPAPPGQKLEYPIPPTPSAVKKS